MTKKELGKFLALQDRLHVEAMALLAEHCELMKHRHLPQWITGVSLVTAENVEFEGYDGCDSLGWVMPTRFIVDPAYREQLRAEVEAKDREAAEAMRLAEINKAELQRVRDRETYERLKAVFEPTAEPAAAPAAA